MDERKLTRAEACHASDYNSAERVIFALRPRHLLAELADHRPEMARLFVGE